MKIRAAAPLLALCLGLAACVAAETKQLARDQAAVSDADYREWDRLTADQKKVHAFDHARSSAALNFALNDVPVPPAYATSASATAAPSGPAPVGPIK